MLQSENWVIFMRQNGSLGCHSLVILFFAHTLGILMIMSLSSLQANPLVIVASNNSYTFPENLYKGVDGEYIHNPVENSFKYKITGH